MTQLVPIALDLVIDPEAIATRVIEWMMLQGAGPRDADEQGKIQIAAIKTCHLVQELARELGRSMDERAQRLAELQNDGQEAP